MNRALLIAKLFLLIGALLILTGSCKGRAALQNEMNVRAAVVDDFDGEVSAYTENTEIAAFRGLGLVQEDGLATGASSWASLELTAGRFAFLDENTEIVVAGLLANMDGNTFFYLDNGTIWLCIKERLAPGDELEVHTPNLSLSVRGTAFSAYTDGSFNIINVYSGLVAARAQNRDGEPLYDENGGLVEFNLTAGQSARIVVENDIVIFSEITELHVLTAPPAITEKLVVHMPEVFGIYMDEGEEELPAPTEDASPTPTEEAAPTPTEGPEPLLEESEAFEEELETLEDEPETLENGFEPASEPDGTNEPAITEPDAVETAPEPAATPTPMPTPTPEETPVSSPSPTPMQVPVEPPTPTPISTPTPIPTPSPTPTLIATPTPTPNEPENGGSNEASQTTQTGFVQYSYADLSHQYVWEQGWGGNIEAIGACLINFQLIGDLTNVAGVYIAYGTPRSGWTLPEILEYSEMITQAWGGMGIHGHGSFDGNIRSTGYGAYPIFPDELGISGDILLLVLDIDYNALGYVLIPSTNPSQAGG